MMKILQVIPTLGQGGAEHFTVELTNELINQGFNIFQRSFVIDSKKYDYPLLYKLKKILKI